MNMIYKEILSKESLVENEVKGLFLLYYATHNDNEILSEFVKNYDANLEDLMSIVFWLEEYHHFEIEMNFSMGIILCLLARDIKDGQINLKRIMDYMEIFQLSNPTGIIEIYKYLSDNSAIIDLNEDNYQRKKCKEIFKKINSTKY